MPGAGGEVCMPRKPWLPLWQAEEQVQGSLWCLASSPGGEHPQSPSVEMSLCTTLRRLFQVTVPRGMRRWEERGPGNNIAEP